MLPQCSVLAAIVVVVVFVAVVNVAVVIFFVAIVVVGIVVAVTIVVVIVVAVIVLVAIIFAIYSLLTVKDKWYICLGNICLLILILAYHMFYLMRSIMKFATKENWYDKWRSGGAVCVFIFAQACGVPAVVVRAVDCWQ